MGITVAGAIAGLEDIAARINDATRQIAADAAHLIQAETMKEVPVGVSGNSTNYAGDLRRSIDVEGPQGSNGTFLARVGPTVVYGRQRELGGDIYPRTATYLRFTKFGTTVYTRHVYQEPNPYLARGETSAIPKIAAVAQARIAAVITGS